MTTHAMIDLETLGTKPDTVILTIGGVKFNPNAISEHHSELYYRFEVDEQLSKGRTTDKSTLEWWQKQDPAVMEEALGDHDRVSVDELTKTLNKWCVGLDELWCQGPLFDYAILQNLYKQLGKPAPWNYWQIRDSRTVFSMMPSDPRKAIQEDAHNALADCYYQAKCIQSTFNHFGVKKR